MFGFVKQWIIDHGKLRNIVLFESYPDFSCNTEPVYLYLQDKLPNYELVWLCSGNEKKAGRKCIYTKTKNPFDILKLKYYRSFYRVAISSNVFIRKRRSGQYSLFLGHGSKTKKTKGIYEMGPKVDYVNIQSHFFDEVTADEYGCKKNQFVYLGYPRCDCFFTRRIHKSEILKSLKIGTDNYFVWLPTFRKQKTGRDDGENSVFNLLGMPLVYTEDDLSELNTFLRCRNMSIIYKPHPAQDTTVLKSKSLSNIKVISDELLSANNLQLYDVIAESTALITDYSSVYYDYLLLNRPIATTTDDINAWKQNRGFAFDIEKIYNDTTVRISNLDELYSFISNTLNGIDNEQLCRQEMCKLTNMHQDGLSAKRVGDFVIDLLSNEM